MTNPFKVMKLWMKWEQLDIEAMLEAIQSKSVLERDRFKNMARKLENQKDLEKLKKGQKTFKTMFLSKKGQVSKITELNQKIQNVSGFNLIMALNFLHNLVKIS